MLQDNNLSTKVRGNKNWYGLRSILPGFHFMRVSSHLILTSPNLHPLSCAPTPPNSKPQQQTQRQHTYGDYSASSDN